LVAATLWLGALPLVAATNEVTRKLQPARWLFVVDVSDKMGDRSKVIAGVIGELVVSGVNGQLKEGDQIGLWTFDKKLNAGIAPLQTWQTGQSNLIAGRTAKFVAEQKFGGKSKLSAVVPELTRVVKDSRRLTVLIFSDASQTISGTPYDQELNAAYAAKKAEGSETRMPLVTVLRSAKGKFIGQSVSFAPWLEYPAFTPDPEELKAKAAVKPAPEPKKAIIIGSGPKPTQPTTNVLVVSPQPVTPAVDTPATPVPEIQPVQPAAPPIAPAPRPAVQPAAVVPATLATQAQLATNPPAAESAAPTAAPDAEATVAPAAQASAAVSEPDSDGGILSRKWLLILGLGCMWIAIVMALLLVRRSKRSTRASLITRSFDRKQR
jgi:hypothetical protein